MVDTNIVKLFQMKRLQITGRLAANAEVKTHDGKHILEARVYCDDSRGQSHIVKVTQFFKEEPKNVDLFKKGNLVSAYGESKVNAWNDKEGKAMADEVLYADRFHLEAPSKENAKQD